MRSTPRTYLVVNAAKGGVIKYFDRDAKQLKFNDSGILAELEDGRVVTSQWIDEGYRIDTVEGKLTIRGITHRVPTKLFTPLKFIVFRIVMLSLGWNTWLAYQLKGLIRKLLMTRAAVMPASFKRELTWHGDALEIVDTIGLENVRVRRLLVGDEMPVRYVPQSRYFQPQELDVEGWYAPPAAIELLNRNQRLVIRRRVGPTGIESTEYE